MKFWLPTALVLSIPLVPITALANIGDLLLDDPNNVIILPGAHSNSQQALQVLSVGDGDTLTVTDGEQKTTIRVACIDAPERKQVPYGEQSKARLLKLAPVGSEIRLDVKDTDRYGRTVAEVFNSGELNIGLALVQEGQAVAYRKYLSNCNSSAYLAAEQQAQKGRKAFWDQAAPVMPWDYRRGSRPQAQTETQTSDQTQRCDPNYAGACIQPYSQGDVNCGDISARRFRSIGSDPHRLDGDKDGIACEGR